MCVREREESKKGATHLLRDATVAVKVVESKTPLLLRVLGPLELHSALELLQTREAGLG